MTQSAQVTFGILSTANIVNVFVNAVNHIPHAVCKAVASRDEDRARQFAKRMNIERACTYEKLLKEPVDAVYIPIPTALATEWAVRFAKSGKHIIVEKPFANAEAVQSIIDACNEAGVFFLDGTHFVHAARTKTIQTLIQSAELGSIVSITASFTVPIGDRANNIRFDTTLEPYGAIGDLSWYTSRAALAFIGMATTSHIHSVSSTATSLPKYPETISSARGVVEFGHSLADRVTLVFESAFSFPLRQQVEIVCEKGSIFVPSFVLPERQVLFLEDTRPKDTYSTDMEFTIDKSISHIDENGDACLTFPARQTVVVKEPHNLPQAAKMVEEFCRIILEKDTVSAKRWAQESVVTQKIVDAVYSASKK